MVVIAVCGAILIALLPPEHGQGRRSPGGQGRRPPAENRPQPPTWPEQRVPVRYAAGDEAAAPGPADDPGAGESDQPDVVMRDTAPGEWSVGTVFSVDAGGVFVTAAHVTDACAQVALVDGPLAAGGAVTRLAFASEIVQHARADVAVVRAAYPAGVLPLGDDALLERGATGFGFGYPSNVAGVVVGELMGRARGRAEAASAFWPILVWALTARYPDSDAPLGGISGGPMVDVNGRVVGVVVASASERRPRFITTTAAPVREVLRGATRQVPADRPMGAAITAQDAATYGASLRRDGTVAQAVCRRPEPDRRER
jgi:S1-C subfamily serine protease